MILEHQYVSWLAVPSNVQESRQCRLTHIDGPHAHLSLISYNSVANDNKGLPSSSVHSLLVGAFLSASRTKFQVV